jgi:hypothetical protein
VGQGHVVLMGGTRYGKTTLFAYLKDKRRPEAMDVSSRPARSGLEAPQPLELSPPLPGT